MAIVFKDLIAVNEDYSSFLKEFASDVKAGLTNIPKTLPQKYLYDNRGSEISGGFYWMSKSTTPQSASSNWSTITSRISWH